MKKIVGRPGLYDRDWDLQEIKKPKFLNQTRFHVFVENQIEDLE